MRLFFGVWATVSMLPTGAMRLVGLGDPLIGHFAPPPVSRSVDKRLNAAESARQKAQVLDPDARRPFEISTSEGFAPSPLRLARRGGFSTLASGGSGSHATQQSAPGIQLAQLRSGPPAVVDVNRPRSPFDCSLPIGIDWYGSREWCLEYLCGGKNVYNEYIFDQDNRRRKNPCYGQSPTDFGEHFD